MELTGNAFVFVLFVELCMANSDHNEVAILKQMQDWGYGVFLSLSIETNITKGQYLVAVVMEEDSPSPENFTKYLFDGCPFEPNFEERKLQCKSSAVILNLESEDVWKRSDWADDNNYQKHKWHGEYRLLKDGIVEDLTNNFLADRPNVRCKIYLYSYYIPCAGILKQPYSCSAKIADYNNAPTTKCKVVLVGYTEVFRRSGKVYTNEQESKDFLHKAYAELKHITSEVKVTAIRAFLNESIHKSTLQELMFNYVMNSPLSGCCVINEENENSEEIRNSIVSYFVNAMIFNLKGKKDLANSGMNKSTKKKMMGYIESWLSNTVGEECPVCSVRKGVRQYLLGFCAKTALDLSTYFGEPEKRNDLSIPKWTPLIKGKLSNIRMIAPSKFKKTKKGMAMCGLRRLSTGSLCSSSKESTLPAVESDESDVSLYPDAKMPRHD